MPPQRNLAIGPNTLEIGSLKGNVHPEPMDIPIYEIAPPGSQVMDMIGQLVSALDRDRLARHLVEGTGCSLKDFYSHHLASFDRRGNHISAKNWLNDVEELLAATRCTDEQKVAYTIYKLAREAKHW
jgi:hypothetical protein